MINLNKCPKCDSVIESARVEDISLDVQLQPTWKGFSYGCPTCGAILGVQMNPLSLNADLVSDIKEKGY
jgi:predicted RNA-binding Zn-ribbon protein involved in translation (DUF1610 family)